MGDFLSKGSKSFTDYRPTGKSLFHPILGEFPLMQSPTTGQSSLQKKVDLSQLEGSNTALLRSHLLLTHPNIVKFEGYEQVSQTQYHVYFENFDCTLKQEIQRRAAANTRFTEKEIVELLRNISAALAYLEGNRIVHGQIRTETIVKVGSEYKLLNMTIFGNYKSTYQQALEEMRKTQIRLLSPQLQDALYNKIVDPVHEGYKDDVYALGVVTLDIMTLNVDTGVPIPEKLAKASQYYSKTLLSVVNKMLENIMSLRLDCISCNRVIENNYVQRDIIPQGLYSSKFLQRSSIMRSSYKNEVPEQRLSTGVSLNDIKKYSPAYRKSEKTMNEQNFSPTRNAGRDKQGYVPLSSTHSPERQSNYSTDLGRGYDPLRIKETESVYNKSYIHENIYQSPPQPTQASNLNMRPLRTSSVPKNRYQPWESNSSSVHSQNPYLHKSNYQTDYNPVISSHQKTDLSERNLSPIIKNDPLILSILSQEHTHNSPPSHYSHIEPNKDTGYRTSNYQFSSGSGYEKPKSSNLFSTPEHGNQNKLYRVVESGHANKLHLNAPSPDPVTSYAHSKPPLQHHTNQPFTFQLYSSQTGTQQPYVTSNVHIPLTYHHMTTAGQSEPMKVDGSPVYAGYSQIQEDVHNNGRSSQSFLSRSRMNFS